MSRLQPSFVLGYHGCSRAVGEALLAGETSFALSRNPYDWLGPGVYFWESDPLRAWDWARRMTARSGGEPFVVGAVIDLGDCLDATTLDGAKVLSAAYRSLRADMDDVGDDLPFNHGGPEAKARYLDCAVVKRAHALAGDQPFDSVRALFPEGQPLYDGAGFWARTHIQIAVLSMDNIKGVFRIAAPLV